MLSFFNSWGTDGTFGNQDSERSVLAEVGKAMTPALTPMGISQDNWPATVGMLTGIFAKETVVGTLNALYGSLADGRGCYGRWRSRGLRPVGRHRGGVRHHSGQPGRSGGSSPRSARA